MDPLSITASASAIITICNTTVTLIKYVIETVKNSKKSLVGLLSQTESLRLHLEHLRSLTKQLGARAPLLLSYNDSAPRLTVNELHLLVKSIADKPAFLSLQMLLKKNKVDSLTDRLKRHEEDIVRVLITIATDTAVRTEDEVHQMHEESKAQSEVIGLFEDYFSSHSASTSESGSSHFKPSRSLQIWFGNTYRDGFSDQYLALRDQLSDAAYMADFERVFETLEIAEQRFGESWVNAPRLSHDPGRTSGWTPLHQATFMGAPKAFIDRLLDLGALRTIRTNWTNKSEVSYLDMTAGEIAQELGMPHLCEILAPGVRNGIPPSKLQKLQESFHTIIENDLDLRGTCCHLRLPDLSPLTELDVPEMWFPIKKSGFNNPQGYLYRLDGRELLVKAFGTRSMNDSRLYRISHDEIHEILDGVTFNTLLKT